jgi:hypothetical protein
MSDISIAAMASAVQHLVGNATNLSVRISFEARPNSRPTGAYSSRSAANLDRKVVQSGDERMGFDRPRRRRGSQLKPDPLGGVIWRPYLLEHLRATAPRFALADGLVSLP